MRLIFWKRREARTSRPVGAPPAARYLSAEYRQAERDLHEADAREDRWHSLLKDRNTGALFTAEECVDKIFDARRQKISALWRLGWDDSARRAQADLDMRLSWPKRLW